MQKRSTIILIAVVISLLAAGFVAIGWWLAGKEGDGPDSQGTKSATLPTQDSVITGPHSPLATPVVISPLDTPVVHSPIATPDWEGKTPAYSLWLPSVSSDKTTPTPMPTTKPSPTPTPTPAWPDTMAEPGPSKLGLHVIRNNTPWIIEFIKRVKPAVVKAVGDVGWLNDVKRHSPTTVTIGRLHATHQTISGDPVAAAQSFVAEQRDQYLLNPAVDYWEGWNEVDPGDQMAWFAAFEAERVRLMAEMGLKTAVGGFAVGQPEFEGFLEFLPAIEAAREHGGILTVHEYGAPTMSAMVGTGLPGFPSYPDRGVLTLRYRWWYDEILKPRSLVLPLVISEAGIDGGSTGMGDGRLGWREFTDQWNSMGIPGGIEGYIDQLGWYDQELRKDPYVLGFTVFTAGEIDSWVSFGINHVLPEIAVYVSEVR